MDTTKMQVEIWSDIACPFCYIGKRNFESGIKNFADAANITVTWKSFQLDPTLPEKATVDHEQYLIQYKGLPAERVKQMLGQVARSAKSAGLDYHFDKIATVNSFNAHRLIQLAKTKGLGDDAEERLFKAYFTEGKNIADKITLIELGKEIGLSESEVDEALTNEAYAHKAKLDIEEARQLGVNGVPFFVFDRKYAVSGAQPPEAFTQTLEKAFAEWRTKNPDAPFKVSQGASCTTDGNCE